MKAAKNAISILKSFRQRKAMYIQPVSVETAHSFLIGFYIACMACGLADDWGSWVQAAQSRGWSTGAVSPVPAMHASGMDEEAIIDELISICQEAIAPASRPGSATNPLPGSEQLCVAGVQLISQLK